MHTKDKLAAALRDIDLQEMADKAAAGYYHDFLSELDLPTIALVKDLERVGTTPALQLRKRVLEGEFDATKEEADAWAESPEGQETLSQLLDK